MGDYAMLIVLGKAGEDPVKKAVGDKELVRLSVACNDSRYKGKTEWFKAIFWGKLADAVVEHVAKGSLIEIHGYPHLHTWNDQNGRTFMEIQVKVERCYFLNTPRKPSGYNPDEKL